MRNLARLFSVVLFIACASSIAATNNMIVLKKIALKPDFTSGNVSFFKSGKMTSGLMSKNFCKISKHYSKVMRDAVVIPVGAFAVSASEETFERQGRFNFKAFVFGHYDHEKREGTELTCFLHDIDADLTDVNKILKGKIVIQ